LAGSFIGGCQYGRSKVKCPEIVSNTVLVHDSIIHHIVDTFPYYIVKRDSIIKRVEVPANVDTAAILQAYYDVYKYDRQFKDSLLQVNLTDYVSQNDFQGSDFSYKILRAQTIVNNTIDNTVTYNRYIYFGLDVPLMDVNYVELEATFNWERGYVGVGWEPKIKSINLKAGVPIFKFKK